MVFWHTGTTLVVLWFVMRGNARLDYRLAVLGALLPDIIDKTLGRVILRDKFGSGRLYAHTLLINVLFFSILFFMRGRHKRRAVLVPIGSLLHLAEDGMWSVPQVFWWPLFGTGFPRTPLQGEWWRFAIPHRGGLIQEGIGLALLIWLFAAHGMLNRQGLRTFIRTGRLEPSVPA